jgi:hypothetical protein
MRKYSLFILAVLTLLTFSACKKSHQKTLEEIEKEAKPEVAMQLGANDTIEVHSLVDHFIECLSNKNVDAAVDMLYVLNNDSVVSLPAKMAKTQKILFNRFQGVKYDVEHLIFYSETDTEVKYTVTLFEKKDENDNRPNKISFYLKPVRRNGKWYLTMGDTMVNPNPSHIKH